LHLSTSLIIWRSQIAINKNTVPGDKSAFIPGGIRIGTPALTSRGFGPTDFEQVAEFIHRGVVIAKEVRLMAPLMAPWTAHAGERLVRGQLIACDCV